MFALEKNCKNIQVFGDSNIIINWATGIQQCHNIHLKPILEEVGLLQAEFITISVSHIYGRERN